MPVDYTRDKARCYAEYCCNTATHNVVVVNRGLRPDMPPIPWGWCTQHLHWGTKR